MSGCAPNHRTSDALTMLLHPKVSDYIAQFPERGLQLETIRQMLLEAGFEEAWKWNMPCYLSGRIISVGVGCFKQFTSVWFHHGALLADPLRLLIPASSGTKNQRQWRFYPNQAVPEIEFKAYALEAFAAASQAYKLKRLDKPVEIPMTLKARFDREPMLATAFEKLKKTQQRELCDWLDSAKREETRTARLEKIIDLIAVGRSINDQYRRSQQTRVI